MTAARQPVPVLIYPKDPTIFTVGDRTDTLKNLVRLKQRKELFAGGGGGTNKLRVRALPNYLRNSCNVIIVSMRSDYSPYCRPRLYTDRIQVLQWSICLRSTVNAGIYDNPIAIPEMNNNRLT
jgi:hypothetical protein